MSIDDDGISISYLSEMLEGQVAILSSGYLDSAESLKVLQSLRKSALYREDQNSFILYPNKKLPRFLEKNNIPEASILKSEFLQKLVEDGNRSLIVQDVKGGYHFNGNFKNAADVKKAIEELKYNGYRDLAEKDEHTVLKIFEEVFNHKAFTGRSGTFFAYEGLGSIYWHMVSKLHLAVAEVCIKAFKQQPGNENYKSLLSHFYEIGKGIGVHKPPELYGAFPTDAYSHTPSHRGAQQPGMTGQVKEDILTAIYELGVFVENGTLGFDPVLLRKSEFREDQGTLHFINVEQKPEPVDLPDNSLCFSYCQIPVLYRIGSAEGIEIHFSDGTKELFNNLSLDRPTSTQIFQRTGEIKKVLVSLKEDRLNQ